MIYTCRPCYHKELRISPVGFLWPAFFFSFLDLKFSLLILVKGVAKIARKLGFDYAEAVVRAFLTMLGWTSLADFEKCHDVQPYYLICYIDWIWIQETPSVSHSWRCSGRGRKRGNNFRGKSTMIVQNFASPLILSQFSQTFFFGFSSCFSLISIGLLGSRARSGGENQDQTRGSGHQALETTYTWSPNQTEATRPVWK